MGNEKLRIKKLFALSSENRKFSFPLPLKHSIKIGKREYEVKLKADEKLRYVHIVEKSQIPCRNFTLKPEQI
jgi:hypothetical protein